jgi:hypothetical protein
MRTLAPAAYHGTPITPYSVLHALGCRDYFVSYFRPDQVEWIDANARSWVADNGIFSAWMKGIEFSDAYWQGYYDFCRRWCLGGNCAWAVIPDPIGTGTQELDYFIREWPADLKDYGVPVYHLDEPIDRAIALLERFGRLCVGATGEYRAILSLPFCERMDDLFNAIHAAFGRIPPIHFFRGLQLLKPGCDWPITSADSTDIARNHNRRKALGPQYLWAVQQAAGRWDAMAANRDLSWPPERRAQLHLFTANDNPRSEIAA